MTSKTKPASRRFGLASLIALGLALPAAGLALSGASTPALANEAAVKLAPAAPLNGSVAGPFAAASLVEKAPAYQTVGSGMASYYGRELAGNRTASGERFNPSALTAAHRTLPLGSKVRVTNSRTGESVVVRINDRGPFHSSRLIDLSEAAARQIGIKAAGRGVVEIAVSAD